MVLFIGEDGTFNAACTFGCSAPLLLVAVSSCCAHDLALLALDTLWGRVAQRVPGALLLY